MDKHALVAEPIQYLLYQLLSLPQAMGAVDRCDMYTHIITNN